jgi:CheY-like chemotaxis protein/CRP-like cAMP-binding protein
LKSILVIEDNTEVRENICEILELSGYSVASAVNGKDGIEKAIKEKPDLILCDVMMPRLDGYGVLKILRANKLTNHIPFIFLTARVNKEDFRKGMGLGADDYITKPFDDTDLLEAIEIRLTRQEENETTYSDPGKAWYQESVVNEWIENYIKSATAQQINTKDVLYTEGSGSNHMYYVSNGLLKEVFTSDDGKSLITGLYGQHDFVGMSEVIQNQHRQTMVSAIAPTTIYAINKETILHLLSSNRILSKYFLILSHSQLAEAKINLINQAYSSVRKKVAEAILKFDRYKIDGGGIQVSREDLSMLAGVAKETLIRTLTAFKSEKLITTKNKKIVVLDRKALVDLPQ